MAGTGIACDQGRGLLTGGIMNELISAPATWTASMESPVSEHGNLWAIVLAGGEGVRLRSLTRRLYGYDRPKQYAALVGARSLLRQTLDRVGLLIPPERTVVVTLASHARYVEAELRGAPRPHVLAQPYDRGTAAGIFLPAHWIRLRDPDATVVVFPSDHFVLVRLHVPRGRRGEIRRSSPGADHRPRRSGHGARGGVRLDRAWRDRGLDAPGSTAPDPPLSREAVPGAGGHPLSGWLPLEHVRVRGESGRSRRGRSPLRAPPARPIDPNGSLPRRSARAVGHSTGLSVRADGKFLPGRPGVRRPAPRGVEGADADMVRSRHAGAGRGNPAAARRLHLVARELTR